MNEKAKCKNCTDKMIEEMAFDLIKATSPLGVKDLTEVFNYEKVATDLCNLWNWRKILEGSVVLSKEEYAELKQAKSLLAFREETIKYLEDANIRYAEALELKVNKKERKETAKEILQELWKERNAIGQLMILEEHLIKLAKKHGVEVKE